MPPGGWAKEKLGDLSSFAQNSSAKACGALRASGPPPHIRSWSALNPLGMYQTLGSRSTLR